jgi:hypothetical protein
MRRAVSGRRALDNADFAALAWRVEGARRTLAAMDWLPLLQWPAMVVTVVAAWCAASKKKGRRRVGFWTYLASNALWIAWGWGDHAWALITLQMLLAAMNIRGVLKNDPEEPQQE